MNTVRTLNLTLITLVSLGTHQVAGAQGFLDTLKDKVKEETVEKTTKKVTKRTIDDAQSSTTNSKNNSGKRSAGLGQPSAKLVSMTNCADLKIENIMIGNVGEYTFQQGFTQEKRDGFINRRAAKASSGCILPSLSKNDYMYMEVDATAYENMGSYNDWEMQCVKSANPSAGAVGQDEPKSEYPYKIDFLAAKHLMLHCGNSEGVKECAEGSNNSRGSAWEKNLKERGKAMLSVYAVTSTLAPAQGEKLYCQYFNKPSRKALFAFEYLRVRN